MKEADSKKKPATVLDRPWHTLLILSMSYVPLKGACAEIPVPGADEGDMSSIR